MPAYPHTPKHKRLTCALCHGTGTDKPRFDGTYPTPEGKVAGHVPESEGI